MSKNAIVDTLHMSKDVVGESLHTLEVAIGRLVYVRGHHTAYSLVGFWTDKSDWC